MDEDEFEEFHFEEEEEIEEELPPPQPEPEEEAEPEEELPPPANISEVPLTVSVEVGRVRLSAEKLLSLQPGNLIDLPTSPDSRVELVVNGKVVGRGELLRIGDLLGVRVLELG